MCQTLINKISMGEVKLPDPVLGEITKSPSLISITESMRNIETEPPGIGPPLPTRNGELSLANMKS
jgi:hypothetical protein